MLRLAKSREAKVAAALAAAGLALTPAFATADGKKRPAAVSLTFDGLSSFTPANADPKLAAALAGKSLSLNDFKFTPAPAKGRPSQVRVAVRARVAEPTEAAVQQASAPRPRSLRSLRPAITSALRSDGAGSLFPATYRR